MLLGLNGITLLLFFNKTKDSCTAVKASLYSVDKEGVGSNVRLGLLSTLWV